MPEDEDPFAHITVSESHDSRSTSRSTDDAQCRQFFAVQGALSGGEAEARIRAVPAPPEVTYRADVSYDVQPVFFDREHPENNIFEVSRSYSKKQGNTEDDEIPEK